MTSLPIIKEKEKIDDELVAIRAKSVRKNKPNSALLIFGVIIGVLVPTQLYLLYAIYYPTTVFKYTVIPVPVITKQIHRGERLQYKVSYCKYVDVGSTVTFQVVGPTNFQAPPITSNLKVGCDTINASNVSLPANMVPGDYTVNITNTFVINAFRTVAIRNYIEKFTVLP